MLKIKYTNPTTFTSILMGNFNLYQSCVLKQELLERTLTVCSILCYFNLLYLVKVVLSMTASYFINYILM